MTPHDSEPAAPKSDRAAKGQFARGNKGGPGNPFARRVAELRSLLLEAISGDDLQAICKAMIERARNGDVAAAKLLFQYALGKPAAAVEPDRVEIDEHRLRLESTVPITEMGPTHGYMQADTVNMLMDHLGPVFEENTVGPLREGIVAMNAAPPGEELKAGKKAMKRALRDVFRGHRPSANGSNGCDFDDRGRDRKRPSDPAGPAWVG
jgi:hypothetical protein